MPSHMVPEDIAVARFIEKMDLADTTKSKFLKTVRENGLTEEIVESIRQKLVKPAPENDDPFKRGKDLAEFTSLVKRWRISRNKKQFHERR